MAYGDKCPKCGFHHWDHVRCLDTFEFQHENWGDEFQVIGAYNFEDAAERFAKKYDEDDHPLLEGSAVVLIRHAGETKAFRVSAEPSIDYSYDEITMAEYEKEGG